MPHSDPATLSVKQDSNLTIKRWISMDSRWN